MPAKDKVNESVGWPHLLCNIFLGFIFGPNEGFQCRVYLWSLEIIRKVSLIHCSCTTITHLLQRLYK